MAHAWTCLTALQVTLQIPQQIDVNPAQSIISMPAQIMILAYKHHTTVETGQALFPGSNVKYAQEKIRVLLMPFLIIWGALHKMSVQVLQIRMKQL